MKQNNNPQEHRTRPTPAEFARRRRITARSIAVIAAASIVTPIAVHVAKSNLTENAIVKKYSAFDLAGRMTLAEVTRDHAVVHRISLTEDNPTAVAEDMGARTSDFEDVVDEISGQVGGAGTMLHGETVVLPESQLDQHK
jgi:hypothetical protein